MHTPVRGRLSISPSTIETEENEDSENYRCNDCNVNFTSEHYLLGHLLHHIKQPTILVHRLELLPIKLTLKTNKSNNFEIINSTSTANYKSNSEYLAEESQTNTDTDNSEENIDDPEITNEDRLDSDETNNFQDLLDQNSEISSDITSISLSPNFVSEMIGETPQNQESDSETNSTTITNSNISGDIPGAEPTPPPESPSPTDYPKIRIKTVGLLKAAPLTITEITDDNPNGDSLPSEIIEIPNSQDNNSDCTNFWSTQCLEDPLKLPDTDRDDSNLLSNFLNNNNDQAKAFGITTDNEFMSLDRLDDRNRSALQIYNPSSSAVTTSSLDTLTGLPMQQLAEQVSRLQPSGGGMHQQNVLINIQQFPQAAPQPPHGYPMYPHPPHPGMNAQPPPMYQPYQYQPNPVYYPPAPPAYPPPPHMPPHTQMSQPNQQISQQPMPPRPQTMPPPQQPPQYRQAMPPRPPAPRQYNQQPPQRNVAPRAPAAPRQRAPIMRPRAPMPNTNVRGPRPRMPNTNMTNVNGVQNNQMQNQTRIVKRTPEQIQSLQAKKKRMDVLVPDKNDDADCQVIAVQPKNMDGGLPQIQSVQGGTSDPIDNVMHLSDSITLSVRNPPPKSQSPKKSDAKVVANILATRGITVTASPKPKEKITASKESAQAPSVAINLNSAVSIIPTAKTNSSSSNNSNGNDKSGNDSRLPTVDLTDDTIPDPPRTQHTKQQPSAQQKTNNRGTALPFRCDLCPAQYPSLMGLNKHRQSYHKTGSPCEIGIPLIDLRQAGIVQKLTNIGIYNFIPLPSSTPDGHFALPVVSVNAARNSAVCNLNALGASSILTLGPVRSLPKSQTNSNSGNK